MHWHQHPSARMHNSNMQVSTNEGMQTSVQDRVDGRSALKVLLGSTECVTCCMRLQHTACCSPVLCTSVYNTNLSDTVQEVVPITMTGNASSKMSSVQTDPVLHVQNKFCCKSQLATYLASAQLQQCSAYVPALLCVCWTLSADSPACSKPAAHQLQFAWHCCNRPNIWSQDADMTASSQCYCM